MPYTVQIPKKVKKELAGLATEAQARIITAMERLGIEPRPVGAVMLEGRENRWRIRIGDYRVIYEIRDNELLVLVVKVGHRREVYER